MLAVAALSCPSLVLLAAGCASQKTCSAVSGCTASGSLRLLSPRGLPPGWGGFGGPVARWPARAEDLEGVLAGTSLAGRP